MSDKVLAELFAQPIPEPPLPPDHLEGLLARARRSQRRRRLRAALLALLTVLLAAVTPAALPNAGSGERVRLPDHISGYFPLTASVGAHPPGRSLVLMRSGNMELFDTRQTLLIGTDGRTYRDLADEEEPLLSPDGTMVIICRGMGVSQSLTIVDLLTGRRRTIPLETPKGVRIHAWSPDLRYVSYSTVEAAQLDNAHFVDDQMRKSGVLSILDLQTGQSTRFPTLTPAIASAFTPDSRSLAVQLGPNEAWVIWLDGAKQRRLALPPGTGIAPGIAWSPDGRRIATVPWARGTDGVTEFHSPAEAQRAPETGGLHDRRIGFADANGTPLSDLKGVADRQLLGWRSPHSIITVSYRGLFPTDKATIEEVDLSTGQTTVLSRVDHGHACQLFTDTCYAGRLQLATGLLERIEVTPAGLRDSGPWLTGIALSVLLVVVFFLVMIALGIRAAVRRRRPSGSGSPGRRGI